MLVSGGGTNLGALLEQLPRSGGIAQVARVIASRPDAGALERATKAGVATAVVHDANDTATLLKALEGANLVVLAGYVRQIPAPVVARYRHRMINIHPALLPAFGGPGMYGRRVHEQVLAAGVTFTGATVHYVDEEYDRGPIIAQWPVPVRSDDTPETLAARVLAVEHRLLPLVVTALARHGVPDQPMRLRVTAPAFIVGDQIDISLE